MKSFDTIIYKNTYSFYIHLFLNKLNVFNEFIFGVSLAKEKKYANFEKCRPIDLRLRLNKNNANNNFIKNG